MILFAVRILKFYFLVDIIKLRWTRLWTSYYGYFYITYISNKNRSLKKNKSTCIYFPIVWHSVLLAGCNSCYRKFFLRKLFFLKLSLGPHFDALNYVNNIFPKTLFYILKEEYRKSRSVNNRLYFLWAKIVEFVISLLSMFHGCTFVLVR